VPRIALPAGVFEIWPSSLEDGEERVKAPQHRGTDCPLAANGEAERTRADATSAARVRDGAVRSRRAAFGTSPPAPAIARRPHPAHGLNSASFCLKKASDETTRPSVSLI